jgi:hypothetical protein
VPGDLHLGDPLDELDGQPAVAQEAAAAPFLHGPQAEAVGRVPGRVPVDHRPDLVSAVGPRIETHGLRIAEQRRQVIQIVPPEVPDKQPFRFQDGLAHMWAIS